ncbi:MAG: hypothetical protein ACT4PE_17230 [Candidatus Eiseniibacteriota bacterium]
MQLTTDPAADNHPCWSPDGEMIAFDSARSGNFDIWTMPAACGAATRVTGSTYRNGNLDIAVVPVTLATAVSNAGLQSFSWGLVKARYR